MKIQFVSSAVILICLISSLQANLIKNEFKNGVCVAESFQDSGSIIQDRKNEFVLIPYITPKEVPPGFNNEEAYTNACLKSYIYTIAKTATPNVIIKKVTKDDTDSTQSVTFADLEYLTEYDVKTMYSQKSPNSATEYVAKTFKVSTCFGAPAKLSNLKSAMKGNNLLISWTKPSDDSKICYYEVTIKYQGISEKKFQVTPNSPSYSYSGDLSKGFTISVEAINDRDFNGKQCNNVRENCKKQASGYESIQYDPPTTTTKAPVRTTTSEASSSYNIKYFSMISSLIFFLVVLI